MDNYTKMVQEMALEFMPNLVETLEADGVILFSIKKGKQSATVIHLKEDCRADACKALVNTAKALASMQDVDGAQLHDPDSGEHIGRLKSQGEGLN